MKKLTLTDEEFSIVREAVAQYAHGLDWADPDFEDPEYPLNPRDVAQFRKACDLSYKLRTAA